MALLHGGQLAVIAQQYQIPESDWLDLSTGIAPFSYPVIDIPLPVWQQLPTISTTLIEVAKQYYQAEHCWPLAGSQQLIEQLPQLWLNKISADNKIIAKHVYLPKVGYKEHQQAWQQAGFELHFYQQQLPSDIIENSVVVVINPNNPNNDRFSIQQLCVLQQQCKKQQALLVIDEAFADIFPTDFSFVQQLNDGQGNNEDVIILRSIGKFFGLAGLRIGFVCSSQSWCEIIKQRIGPWSINGAALYITEQALNDTQWQQTQIIRLQQQSHSQYQILKQYFPHCRIETNALFNTVYSTDAASIHRRLCQQAIYVRLTDENDALRFGIADQLQLERLQYLLSELFQENKI
ncbi:threonine-phosphate decarboxylase [Psychromonas marina]|uniref:Aminotransferase n=1 Tax=Psychromonas marina TaxID=88364 RepID=A0ABQ6E1V5_9GAMM|nr:aminotransferase class I/II-fold pyridoxal phosphate-dependent enzyme [Psychromonas marina]GLS91379.1 threonine-phosphate decarboxylase [Psychromonas marina]